MHESQAPVSDPVAYAVRYGIANERPDAVSDFLKAATQKMKEISPLASTADRMEHIHHLPDVSLKGTTFGSKTTMKRVRWSEDGELTPLPNPGVLTYPDGETLQVDTFVDLLVAYAFSPERRR